MTTKPTPEATPETAPYWEHAAQGELWLPWCADTERPFFPPLERSPFTGGDVVWKQASGRGRLASYVINHRPAPGFGDESRHVIALVELEEGPRLTSNLTTPDEALELSIGMPLRVRFERRGDYALPVFEAQDTSDD